MPVNSLFVTFCDCLPPPILARSHYFPQPGLDPTGGGNNNIHFPSPGLCSSSIPRPVAQIGVDKGEKWRPTLGVPNQTEKSFNKRFIMSFRSPKSPKSPFTTLCSSHKIIFRTDKKLFFSGWVRPCPTNPCSCHQPSLPSPPFPTPTKQHGNMTAWLMGSVLQQAKEALVADKWSHFFTGVNTRFSQPSPEQQLLFFQSNTGKTKKEP